MENKCEGNENKIILGDFNITVDKMDMVEMKHKDFIDVVPKAQDLHSHKIC